MNDFTVKKLEEFLSRIKFNCINVYGILKYIEENPAKGLILRHDVDRSPQNALIFAQKEQQYGIRSTYYFRATKNSFREDIIKQIYELGHEIGYHYEDLSNAQGNYTARKPPSPRAGGGLTAT